MIRLIAGVIAGLCVAGYAYAQIYNSNPPMIPYAGGHGPMVPGLIGPMVPNQVNTTPPPPNPCTGVADFSDGCAIAVFP